MVCNQTSTGPCCCRCAVTAAAGCAGASVRRHHTELLLRSKVVFFVWPPRAYATCGRAGVPKLPAPLPDLGGATAQHCTRYDVPHGYFCVSGTTLDGKFSIKIMPLLSLLLLLLLLLLLPSLVARRGLSCQLSIGALEVNDYFFVPFGPLMGPLDDLRYMSTCMHDVQAGGVLQ